MQFMASLQFFLMVACTNHVYILPKNVYMYLSVVLGKNCLPFEDGIKVVRTGQGLKNNVPSFSIQLIFGHIYEQSQNLGPICALVLE